MALSFVLSALRPIFAAEGKDGETCKAAAHILSVFADKLTQLAEATFDGPYLHTVVCPAISFGGSCETVKK